MAPVTPCFLVPRQPCPLLLLPCLRFHLCQHRDTVGPGMCPPTSPASPEKFLLVLNVQRKSREWRTPMVIDTLHPNYGLHWGWDLQQLDFTQSFASFGY